MSKCITSTTASKTPVTDSDPATAAEFDAALKAVTGKYHTAVALTRGDLLRLAQACIAICEREGE